MIAMRFLRVELRGASAVGAAHLLRWRVRAQPEGAVQVHGTGAAWSVIQESRPLGVVSVRGTAVGIGILS